MRRMFLGAVLVAAVALTAVGCAGSRGATTGSSQTSVSPPVGTTTILPVHMSGPGLMPGSVAYPMLRSIGKSGRLPGTRSIKRVIVYGPGSRKALVKASSGAVVAETAKERRTRFYLLVFHGYFVGSSHPPGTKAPRGTIETQVWSPTTGVTDSGISNRLPAAVSRLNKIGLVTMAPLHLLGGHS